MFYPFFLILTSISPLFVGAEDYCCTWSHSVTHTPSHTHTQYLVGILWTSDLPDAEVCACTPHNVRQVQKFMHPGGIRTCNPSKRAAADSHLRPRDHEDWRILNFQAFNQYLGFQVSSGLMAEVSLLTHTHTHTHTHEHRWMYPHLSDYSRVLFFSLHFNSTYRPTLQFYLSSHTPATSSSTYRLTLQFCISPYTPAVLSA
jgi:hypothetical protein